MQTILAFALLIHVLEIIGLFVLAFFGLIVLMMLGYIQATWGMSEKEREEFVQYIKENGILGHDDFL